MKDLLDQAERDRVLESEKRKEAAAQVVKLTELKTLLQQQIENSGGSVAEKQVLLFFVMNMQDNPGGQTHKT